MKKEVFQTVKCTVEKQNPTYIKAYATCISPAVYYKVCSVCNRVGDDTYEHG